MAHLKYEESQWIGYKWIWNVKRDIRTWKKHLFLYISSTNIETLVPSLYQCVKTCSIEVLWLLSQPIPHLCFIICDFWTSSREFLHSVVNGFTWQTLPTVNMKHFFMNIICIQSFCPQQNAALRYYTPQTWSPFWLLKPASEHAHARLLPRVSWSWTVLQPSDTHREPITSITAVLLQFVTYGLTILHGNKILAQN
jgi:hypothetical protein